MIIVRNFEKKILNEIVLIRNKFPIERSRINKRLLDKSKILVHSEMALLF